MYATSAQRGTETTGSGTDHPVRVSCSCERCAINAARLGQDLPLVAWTTETNAAALRITARNADDPRKVHALVALAHHPVLGRAQRGTIAG